MFCESSLHCAFQRKTDDTRCCNVKSNHGEKGHQGVDGKPLGKGEFQFQDGFDPGAFFDMWNEEIERHLTALDDDARKMRQEIKSASSEAIAAKFHREEMKKLLRRVNVANFVSHHICLCCLRHSMPEYPMPCGQVLCAACARSFRGSPGQAASPSKSLTLCPFHVEDSPTCFLEGDEKPRGAGVRILCLDG